jgi:uncharacterized glyoxalase superfamily protein PhnB
MPRAARSKGVIMTQPIPEGFHSVTPHIVVKDVAKALDWYTKAFGAEETVRMTSPDGRSVLHAEMRIGDSPIMLGEENPQWGTKGPESLGGTPVAIHLYVNDVDALFKKATAAGARSEMDPQDTFWGDRYGKVIDPDGHQWSLATHVRDMTPEEMQQAMAEAFSEKKPG